MVVIAMVFVFFGVANAVVTTGVVSVLTENLSNSVF